MSTNTDIIWARYLYHDQVGGWFETTPEQAWKESERIRKRGLVQEIETLQPGAQPPKDDLRLQEVIIAEPYRPGALGSMAGFNGASLMYLRQHKFPHLYDPSRDKVKSADSDRIPRWDYDHSGEVCTRFFGVPGMGGLPYWVNQRGRTAEEVLEFCKAILKADPEVNWTGFRILGTLNRSNGQAVCTIELFAKGKGSKTKVYSGSRAPNVRSGGWNGHGYRGHSVRRADGTTAEVYFHMGEPEV